VIGPVETSGGAVPFRVTELSPASSILALLMWSSGRVSRLEGEAPPSNAPAGRGFTWQLSWCFGRNPAARKVNALLGLPPGGALNLRAVARRCRAQKNPANTHAPSPFAHRTLCRRIVGAW
jgi:hypothetical protein